MKKIISLLLALGMLLCLHGMALADPNTITDVESGNVSYQQVFGSITDNASISDAPVYYVEISWGTAPSFNLTRNGSTYTWNGSEAKYTKAEGSISDATSGDVQVTITNKSNVAISYSIDKTDKTDSGWATTLVAKSGSALSGTLGSAAVSESGRALTINDANNGVSGTPQYATVQGTLSITGFPTTALANTEITALTCTITAASN